MYYYEKDYIMRLIHGIARILARMLFNKELEDDGGFVTILEESGRESNDYLHRMIDGGQVNAAEEKLFDRQHGITVRRPHSYYPFTII